MTQTELEAAHIAFINEVQARAMKIFGLAGTGRSEQAAENAAILAEFAADARNQFQMQKESAGADRYDLAALAVEPGTLTNSETAYERED